MHKYGAKPLWYDASEDKVYECLHTGLQDYRKRGYEYFASKLEYDVFRQIRSFCTQHRLAYEIHHQHNVTLLPHEKDNKEITWNIDFMLSYSLSGDWMDVQHLFVEAKGYELDDYKLKLDLLKRFQPTIYKHLRVVKDAKQVSKILAKDIF